jgi:hypothetical protein
MTLRQRAVAFAKAEIRNAQDWQDVQTALAEHPDFGPWLGDDIAAYQAIIREAENNLGDDIPADYA